jgi:hypothetical protein
MAVFAVTQKKNIRETEERCMVGYLLVYVTAMAWPHVAFLI